MNLGLLILRVVFGSIMAAHGTQKLFGWFGGYGLDGTGGFFANLGFRPGKVFAALAGATEVAGGLLTALGLFGPVGPALIVSVMIVAAVTVHWGKLFATENGIEVPLLYAAAALALALTGPGTLSIDRLIGLTSPTALTWAALAAGILGGIGNLLIRRPAPASHQVKQAA